MTQLSRRTLLALLPPAIASYYARWTFADNDKDKDLTEGNKGARLDKELVQRWRLGVEITANGPCAGIFATAPVPTNWPEQRVRVVEEDTSPEVGQMTYRELDNGVQQMLVAIPQLAQGRTAKAQVTLEIQRFSLLAPEDPSVFVIPKTLPKDLKKYLTASPYIETRNKEIQKQAKEILADMEDASAWEKVEALYDWVRDNVKYQDGKLKGALAAMHDKTGDCEELTSLFIAFCRINRIPARTVWVPGHCYPEFFLQDDEGVGYWIPCQAAGTRAFGSMPEHRPILQKGDNFKVPESEKPQRYVAEFLQTDSLRGAPPQVKFIRDLMPGK